jgi:hypothetical protein
MVNFNDSQTVSTPALNINKVLIIQRRAELIDALEQYKISVYANAPNQKFKAILRGKLNSLFTEIKSMLKRKYDKKEEGNYQKLKTLIESDDTYDTYEALDKINDFLDELDLTRIDVRRQIDTSKIEEMNQYKGL